MKRSSEVSDALAAITSSFSVPEWGIDECDKVAACEGSCSSVRPLRMVPETERYECMACWDKDTLGPEAS